MNNWLDKKNSRMQEILIENLKIKFSFLKKYKDRNLRSRQLQAINWLKSNESRDGGIFVDSGNKKSYPEVTGYLIPTLIQFGERDLAIRNLEWLYCIQRADGSYTSPEGESYIFDTGQVLRGLVSGINIFPPAKDCANRAADYLCSRMINNGVDGFENSYNGQIPESVCLYVLPPLFLASDLLNKPEYREKAENCLKYYIHHPDFLRTDDLTHFLAYQLEALIDIGHKELALPTLEFLQKLQRKDGSIRGIGSETWVCTTGLAQLAICWYKIGQWESADLALDWLDNNQEPSGGFVGSRGRGSTYFPDVEISWAVKFYLDAHRLRVESFFDRNFDYFSTSIESDDGRFQAVLRHISSHDRVLDVGCGKGRFLKGVIKKFPETRCYGVDISESLLSSIPEKIKTKKGSLENIPYPDNFFDVVFSVEAIEHSPNPDAAVSELVRVTKFGGWIVIIDKQQSNWGRLKCVSWERWPDREYLHKLFNRWCDHVSAESISYDGKSPDGLMVAWQGQKRSALSGEDWAKVIISPSNKNQIVDRVRGNHISPWGKEILISTKFNEKVLEVGCGTGEISLSLAQAGRQVTVIDVSQESLNFVRDCANDLSVLLHIIKANAKYGLPFDNQTFDCVWNSGLLEHFSRNARLEMLKEFARISNDKVIVIVPNASSLAYRIGKKNLETEGNWKYGCETPIQSLREDFEAADIHLIKEYSVGVRHASQFLPTKHPLRQCLENWFGNKSENEMKEYNQGYLLIGIGTVRC
jgi:malonyl-CoA O-methyltransferase